MDINYFKEFIVIAETKNFLEASEVLFMSQSTLSKHIKKLEDELGITLFSRTTRQVQLNEYGELFLGYAKQIVNLQYQYTSALMNKINSQKHTLNIGSIPIMSAYKITDMIMRFKKDNENFVVNLVEEESHKLKEKLRKNECEIAFIRDTPLIDDEDNEFIKIPYSNDHLVAILPAGHRLASKASIRLEQLKYDDFLLLQPNSILYEICMQAFEIAGVIPRIIYTGSQAGNILELVSKGLGVALLMKKPIIPLANNQVVLIDIDPLIISNINLYYRKDCILSPVAKYFIDSLQVFNLESKNPDDNII